jgi:hypothetical protein
LSWGPVESPRERLIKAAAFAELREVKEVRRKCFISYSGANISEVADFVEHFSKVFIPRVIGVSESDPFIDSDDTAYILGRIQQKYMTDSSVTLLLIGACTWSRKFIDWEIYSSLRNDSNNKRNGLLAVQLPSVNGTRPTLPERLRDNLRKDDKDAYARYIGHPSSDSELRGWIEDAFSARTTRTHLIAPAKPRKLGNSPC